MKEATTIAEEIARQNEIIAGYKAGSIHVSWLNEPKSWLEKYQSKLSSLPSLTGTPKQIDWAESIRHSILKGCYELADMMLAKKAWEQGGDLVVKMAIYLENQTAADWWIKCKDISPRAILTAHFKGKGLDPIAQEIMSAIL